MIELTIALILGTLAGTFTGLTPGIHINLVASVLLSFTTKLETIAPISLAAFIVATATTHTFVDFIPSVFLGAPEEDTALSILPGHQMLKEGLAHEAIILSLYGSLAALIQIIIFTPIFIYLIPLVSESIAPILPFLLIFASLYLILREKDVIKSATIFLLAGFLGFAALNLPTREPFLPLLTGLFGSSAILISIKEKTSIPKQKICKLKEIKLKKSEFLKASAGAALSAPLCSFLPGTGSGHAALIGSEIFEQTQKGFLILLGGINTIVIGISFVTLLAVQKTRTGAAVAVDKLLPSFTSQDLTILIIITIISGFLATIISYNLSKIFSKTFSKLNYTYLSTFILIILLVAVIVFTNILGIIVLITATALGIFAIKSGARRINLMGALICSTILYYLI